MPLYDFKCECGNAWEDFVSLGGQSVCKCGKPGVKQMSRPAFIIPAYMQAGTDNSRYEAWFKSDKTQARIKSGELEPAGKGDL